MVDQNLGSRCQLTIDPSWPHGKLWKHPFGKSLSATFLALDDGDISEEAAVTYASTDVIGRAEAYQSYISTANREIPMTFHFQVQGLQTSDEATACQNEVVLPARFLEALKYSVYSAAQERTYQPPPCILRIGDLLTARVIVTSAQIRWRPPYHTQQMIPHGAEVPVTFMIVRKAKSDLSYAFDGNWT